MRILLIFGLLFLSACASKERHPDAETTAVVTPPTEVLDLDKALQQGSVPTVAFLKANLTKKGFEGLDARDPAKSLPAGLRSERIPTVVAKDKSQQQAFLRKFRGWTLARKSARAKQLTADFNCSEAIEAQALGFSLELDFPETSASQASQELHEKVLVCQAFNRQESLFRLSVFAIQKGECGKANEYMDLFPPQPERGVSDRLSYLRSLCSSSNVVMERNPWGGYGILLNEKPEVEKTTAAWTLSTSSGNEDWDRLLASFVELQENNQHETIQYLATKLNYEKFRALPLSFQTSMLVMMSFSGADLPVFQTLHRYLSEHPDKISPSVAGLLFPVRYWGQIVQHSKKADPILVKALIRQESAFNPLARSRAKAAGLMQLIYPTARHFGIRQQKELLSPEASIHAGSEFLAQLIEDFGSVELALAAYNAGPGAVRQWQKRYPTSNIDLFVEMIPYSETREYVRLVKRNYKIYQNLLGVQLQLRGTAAVEPN